MKKSKLGQKYTDLYYENTGNLIKLMIKEPSLAKQTAKVFIANQVLIINLTEGKKVTLENQRKQEILSLLKDYGRAAGKDSDLGKAVHRVYDDLNSGKSLAEFKISSAD